MSSTSKPSLPEFAVYPQLWNTETLSYVPQESSTGGVGGDVNVTNSSLPLPTGASTAARQDTANTSLASIDSKLGSGLASETTLGTRLSESDFDTKTGSLTETAPASDTASSGLNGRLQRIAQRLTSLITALGSPFQAGGSIGNTSFGSTVADGANVVAGAVADAAVTAGANGSISAKLRAISRDLVANIVLAAGSAIIGKVGIDQTTPGTTNKVSIGTDGTVAVTGSVTVTGALTDTQLRNSAVPVSLATAPTTAVTNAGLSNLDVLLSTRTKPADQQHTIVDSITAGSSIIGKVGIDQTTPGTTNKVSIGTDGTVAVTGSVAVTNANFDATLSSRLKAADTLAAVTTVGTITNPVAVTDNATSLTVDAPVANPVFVRLSDGAAAIATLPVSASALPLPSNAASETGGNLATIAAKDFATQTTLALLALAQGAATASLTGPMMQAVVSETPNSYTPDTLEPLSLTSEGRLRVSTTPSYIDQIWGTTFENPWMLDNPNAAAASGPFAGVTHV